MITSLTLQNFKSFGEEQTIPLSPITVLVGPNNSGKSNLISLGRFVQNAVAEVETAADLLYTTDSDDGGLLQADGGPQVVVHRPPVADGSLLIGWITDTGRYASRSAVIRGRLVQAEERMEHDKHGPVNLFGAHDAESLKRLPFAGLMKLAGDESPEARDFRTIIAPLVEAREIKLALSALRQDAEVVPDPRLGPDGADLPAVLGVWRGSDPDRSDELQEFIRRCVPEIKHVLVKPSPIPARQRLWIQQADGEQFDANFVSDGVLCFIALAMHAIQAAPGSLIFIEEPEQSIHPAQLGNIVDLIRQIVHEKQCQVVMATHSPVVVHKFRDEPEAILLFRRGKHGTIVNPLTGFPDLMSALDERRADPGEMLVNGFFNEPS